MIANPPTRHVRLDRARQELAIDCYVAPVHSRRGVVDLAVRSEPQRRSRRRGIARRPDQELGPRRRPVQRRRSRRHRTVGVGRSCVDLVVPGGVRCRPCHLPTAACTDHNGWAGALRDHGPLHRGSGAVQRGGGDPPDRALPRAVGRADPANRPGQPRRCRTSSPSTTAATSPSTPTSKGRTLTGSSGSSSIRRWFRSTPAGRGSRRCASSLPAPSGAERRRRATTRSRSSRAPKLSSR